MKDQSFTTSFTVNESPDKVYDAINNPRAWWSEEIEGITDVVGQEFLYHYQDIHQSRIRVEELIPNKRVVWHVLENTFNFTHDKHEWTDTKVVFDITSQGGKTQLQFTHHGLTPESECYELCHDGWTNYINQSLRDLIATGKGAPITTQGNEFENNVQRHEL